ncbi:glycosyltransferase family 1 protein [Synechococcus sp. RSCCF101]|uniref:glycosyltransferase n=1 Tax=Synechococcus sp. RSCCF101 TaxID=2511069 RepID=UPI001244E42F|nr:glycosyltransferase [Synechococcus sp. RSCCF101]QEY32347.1 glycosyltransferase family 1 protein [Synechococcus sp. RSCCF101]
MAAPSPAEPASGARLVLAYRPSGFPELGGLHRLGCEIVQRAGPDGSATLIARGQSGAPLPGSRPTHRLRQGDRLVVIGCNVAWAYRLVLSQRLRHPRRPVAWLPSFHDPATVRHSRRARLAQLALKVLQRLGVTVHVQTPHEQQLLQAGRGAHCRLSSHGLPADVRRGLEQCLQPAGTASGERSIDLLFVGRPTLQKGWGRFIALAQRSRLRCGAILPSRPVGPLAPPAGMAVLLAPERSRISQELGRSRLVLIPSDYESFGIAQLEAIAAGCVVPILGHWPLWEGFEALQWQQLDDAALLAACERLAADEPRRRALALAQARHVLDQPSARAPWLPGLLPAGGGAP